MSIKTSNLTEKEKIDLIDALLKELGVDNFGSTQDRHNRCNYITLYRDRETIGKVLVKRYDEIA